MSLLELMIATSMLAMVMGTISFVMRTSRQAWEAHEADYTRIESAHSVLRHIVRAVRQADEVTEIQANRLGVLMPSGATWIWDHQAAALNPDAGFVNCGLSTQNPLPLLAPNIRSVTFVGMRADADLTDPVDPTQPTESAADVRCLQIDVTVQLPRVDNPDVVRTVSSWAWVRSW